MAADPETLANAEAHSGNAAPPPVAGAELRAQGAESRIWEGDVAGRPCLIKERFSKQYRHPTLDRKLTTTRLKQEVRGMVKARKLGVRTPVLLHTDYAAAAIFMECVPGNTVKQLLHSGSLADDELATVLRLIGEAVAVLHDGGLVHGDLTTSNLMIRSADKGLVVIDFGLSSGSSVPEDKAVDLYVLERAFKSAHSADGEGLFEVVLQSYKHKSKRWNPTLNKFAEVRMRGRKRAMIG